VLSWVGTEVFNGIFGNSNDAIAGQLDEIIKLEKQILEQLNDLRNDVDWQAAVTRVQPAVTQINAFFQSAQDDLDPPNPESGAQLQKQILDQGSNGIKSALSVIHQELMGDDAIAPGTRGLLELWRDINWSAYTSKSNVAPNSFVRSMQTYLHSVYMLQLKGLTLYVSAALATKDTAQLASTKKENLDSALKTANMVYDNMRVQSDFLYDKVGHACDFFNDFAPRPNLLGVPPGFDPHSLLPGFELTTQIDGVTYLLCGTRGDGSYDGETNGITQELINSSKRPQDLGYVWFLRGDNLLTCYPILQRISSYRDNHPQGLSVQVRFVPGSDNMIEVVEWDTDLDPEKFAIYINGRQGHMTSRFWIRPAGNYFIPWGYLNLVSPYPSEGNAGPARCL
jgi:hypothetical protein